MNMVRSDARTSIMLPEETFEDLKKSAAQNGRSLTAEIKVAIEKYLYENNSITITYDELEDTMLKALDKEEFREKFLSKLKDSL